MTVFLGPEVYCILPEKSVIPRRSSKPQEQYNPTSLEDEQAKIPTEEEPFQTETIIEQYHEQLIDTLYNEQEIILLQPEYLNN